MRFRASGEDHGYSCVALQLFANLAQLDGVAGLEWTGPDWAGSDCLPGLERTGLNLLIWTGLKQRWTRPDSAQLPVLDRAGPGWIGEPRTQSAVEAP